MSSSPASISPSRWWASASRPTGAWVPGDFIVVSSRFNDDVQGYWVTGQLRVDERVSIAVAIGWAPDRETADAAVKDLEAGADGSEVDITGRIISDEGPRVPPHSDPQQLDRMSPAALLSRWHDAEGLDVYRPYLASTTAIAGLVDISSPAPDEMSPVNWLNVFYAVEWAIFAGFAFYLWYPPGEGRLGTRGRGVRRRGRGQSHCRITRAFARPEVRNCAARQVVSDLRQGSLGPSGDRSMTNRKTPLRMSGPLRMLAPCEHAGSFPCVP